MTAEQSVFLTVLLVSAAVALQSIEMIKLRGVFAESGVWRWSTLSLEFLGWPEWLQKFMARLFGYESFMRLLNLRLFLALLFMFLPYPVIGFILVVISFFIALRFLGTFNGASDSMTILMLLFLCVATVPSFQHTAGQPVDEKWQKAALWMIALYSCFSYSMAGWLKLREPKWRSGQVLPELLESQLHVTPNWLQPLLRSKNLSRICAITILIFELSFSVMFLQPKLAAVYLTFGFLFHLLNHFVFGLNRFFFIWIATYPALYYCSQNF